MSIVSNKKLLFLLMDQNNLTYYVEGGVVKKSTIPRWSKHNPNGWKDMSLQFATNQTYFATLRSFTNALKFVEDGQQILADRLLNGKGVEEILYLAILKSDPSKGLNYYGLEYKERIDFSKLNGDPHTGIAENTLPYDVFALILANENTKYSIPCNSSNPKAFPVLYDGTLLQDKANYSVINSLIQVINTAKPYFSLPLAFINNEGDSVGVITNSQNFDNTGNIVTWASDPSNANFAFTSTNAITVRCVGTFSFTSVDIPFGAIMKLFLMKNTDTGIVPAQILCQQVLSVDDSNKLFTFTFNTQVSLAANEKLFVILDFNGFNLTPLATTISLIYASQQTPSVNYMLRPIDALQSIVSQATLGRYTADSNFLRRNNRKCLISGSSLRSFPDAQLQMSFADFYQTYNVPYCLGVAVRNGILWIEPLSDLYSNDNVIFTIPNASAPGLTVAQEYIYASAQVGYQKQNYNQRNGRYEFNGIHNITFPITTVLNKLSLVSPARADSFGAEFIRTNYPNLNTTDDKGDIDFWVVMVSDQIGTTTGLVDNTIPATVVTLILAAPIIKTPFSNVLVYSQYPTIIGVCQPGKLVTIFADGIRDGTTTADASGKWAYQIQTALRPVSLIFNGLHSITANAQNSPTDISDFSAAIILTVNPALIAPFVITSPTPGDALYDNLPVITGTAPQGSVVRVLLDGVQIGIVVANSSSLWSFAVTVPITDGNHTISAASTGLTLAAPVSISMNKNVSTPLITNILFDDTFFTNLPLIKGVAVPATTVQIFIDGGGGPIVLGVAGPVGTAVADANGRWQFQFVNMTDPASDLVITYLPDGLHTFGTTALPVNVPAAVSGYRLMRGSNKGPVMDYASIRLDDSFIPIGVDPATLPPTLGQFLHPETLYNIEETTPYTCLRAHDAILNSFLAQQVPGNIIFNGSEVNANLIRNVGGTIISEGASIAISALAKQLYWPYWLSFKAIIAKTFNQIMTDIVSGGIIQVEINSLTIDCLPIGTMSVQPATDAAQSWKLLIAGSTALTTLVQLFKKGTTFTVGTNMVHFSDYNPLHFVKYNFTPAAGYHFKDIYDDWQKNRQDNYQLYKKDFIQPWQTGDSTPIFAITNGVGVLALDVVNMLTGLVVDSLEFSPVVGSPVQLPAQLQQVTINFGAYPVGQYWFVPKADGVYFAISEACSIATDWPNTKKHEYGGSSDQLDYWFSGGATPMIRVPCEIYTWTPDSEVDVYDDEAGDWEITRGIPSKFRVVQYGNKDHLIPDWMSLKMNMITLLDNLLIEGFHYTRNKDSKWEPQDLGQGIPDVMVKIAMVWAENQVGNTFVTAGDTTPLTTPFVLDGTAFGLDPGVNVVAAQTQ